MTSLRALALLLIFGAAACSPAPSGPTHRIHVPPGAAFSQVADTLSARGIIKTKPLFKLYARLNKSQSSIKPGTYGFLCFIPDPASGKDHATLGMMKKVTVK